MCYRAVVCDAGASTKSGWGDDPQAGMRRYDELWRRKAPTACVWTQETLDAAERCPAVARGRGRATQRPGPLEAPGRQLDL